MTEIRRDVDPSCDTYDTFTTRHQAPPEFELPPERSVSSVSRADRLRARLGAVRPKVDRKLVSMKERGRAAIHHGEDILRSNPLKLTAVATGVGFGIGLLTRLWHRRMKSSSS